MLGGSEHGTAQMADADGNQGRPAEVSISDLQPLVDPAHSRPRPEFERLVDDELLDAARKPRKGDRLVINTRTGKLHDGNGRAHELRRRAADPKSTITPEMTVPVDYHTPDWSAFPDLE